jgi:hypothetical protein
MSRTDRLVSHDIPQTLRGIATDEWLPSSPDYQGEFVSIDTMRRAADISVLSGSSKVCAEDCDGHY